MGFFDMNFNNLFYEKHGKVIYETITKKIAQESPNYTNEYIEVIFKIAYLGFFGLSDNAIQQMIKDIMPNQKVDVVNMKKLNTSSIKEIQKYLNATINKR